MAIGYTIFGELKLIYNIRKYSWILQDF